MESKKSLAQFRLPRWDDLPPVPLYLEQVLALLEEYLGPYVGDGKRKVMTRTMINNYVKLKFIPAPVNKKYDQLTVASLFVIAVLKSVFTIEEIAYLIQLAVNYSEPRVAYDGFCSYLEEAVKNAFHRTTMERERNREDPRQILWNACNAVACQIYVRKIYLEHAMLRGEPKNDEAKNDEAKNGEVKSAEAEVGGEQRGEEE